MDLYNQTSYELSRKTTKHYSTSFSMSSRLFHKEVRPHIYAIYGLVRIADEIVDTYKGEGQANLLTDLEQQTYQAIKSGYSTNPIVHAFALTTRKFDISKELIAPFFQSMRMDLDTRLYTEEMYKNYIYGSAEVIGLMCLKIFSNNDYRLFESLSEGARALGSAYQKVNFLRDMRDDYIRLERVYFPGVNFETFNDLQKQQIENDIAQDFIVAAAAVKELPRSARRAVQTSYDYYYALFSKIRQTDAEYLKKNRVRIPDAYKSLLLVRRLSSW